jgi:hypothetical protein
VYSNAALTLFAAMSPEPDEERKLIMDTTIRRLQSSGWWAGLDGFCVVDGTEPTPAFYNWRNPQVAMNIQNSPDLDPDSGSQGAGVVSEGPRTFWNPATATGANMTASSMCIGAFCLNDSNTTGYDIGNATAFRLAASWTDNLMRANMGSGTGVTLAVPNSTGFRGAFREGTQVKLAADDTISAWQTVAVGGLSSANITIGFQGSNMSVRREFCGFWGAVPAGVTDADIAELKAIITDYFNQVNGVYEISCTITDPTGATTSAPYRVFHDGTVLLDGTMIGSSLDIEAEITPAATPGTPVVSWTDVDTTVSTGPWSGSLTGVTPGSDYKVRARLSNLTCTSPRTSGSFGVGWNIGFGGDSLILRDMSIIDSSPTALGDVRRFVGAAYNGTGTGGWPLVSAPKNANERGSVYGGDGSILIGNDLYAAHPTWSFGFLMMAFPGTTLSQWTDGGDPLESITPANMWDAAEYALTNANSKGAPGWSQIGMWIDGHGVNDANLPGPTAASYEALLGTRVSQLRTATGKAALPYAYSVVGSSEGSPSSSGIAVTAASLNAVRQGQLAFWDANKTDYIDISCGNLVCTRVDQVGHVIPLHQRYIAKLRARQILYVLGDETYPACGPQIASVSVTGNSFVVTCTLSGGTTLQGGVSDTDLTGCEITVDGTVRTVSGVDILSATTFGGTFSGAAATTTALFRYLYGAMLDGQFFDGNATPTIVFTPNYVFDDDVVYADAFPGIPLQPSRDTEGDGWMAASVV